MTQKKMKTKKLETKLSFTHEMFIKLMDTYVTKTKEKFEVLNNVTGDILNEVDFIKYYKDETCDSIQIENQIRLDENLSLFYFRKIKDNSIVRLFQFSVKDFEESENDMFMNLEVYKDNGGCPYIVNDDRTTFEKVKKVIAIMLYLLLVEKRDIDNISNSMIVKLLGEN